MRALTMPMDTLATNSASKVNVVIKIYETKKTTAKIYVAGTAYLKKTLQLTVEVRLT
jgi:hypothetical protein